MSTSFGFPTFTNNGNFKTRIRDTTNADLSNFNGIENARVQTNEHAEFDIFLTIFSKLRDARNVSVTLADGDRASWLSPFNRRHFKCPKFNILRVPLADSGPGHEFQHVPLVDFNNARRAFHRKYKYIRHDAYKILFYDDVSARAFDRPFIIIITVIIVLLSPSFMEFDR